MFFSMVLWIACRKVNNALVFRPNTCILYTTCRLVMPQSICKHCQVMGLTRHYRNGSFNFKATPWDFLEWTLALDLGE